MEKKTSVAALRVCALRDRSGTGPNSRTCKHHSLLKVKRDKTHGRCRWQREKQSGTKFRAQFDSGGSGLDSKQPKKPSLEILNGKNAYHSTTSNMRAHLENVTQMSMPWCLELQLNSHVSTHIFYRPPQGLCLQHDKRHAWRNLLCSYARTCGRSVSLMAKISEACFRKFCQQFKQRNRIIVIADTHHYVQNWVSTMPESQEAVRKRQRMSKFWDHFPLKKEDNKVQRSRTGVPQQHINNDSTSEPKASSC